jgi:hypothetical protein
VLTAISSAVSAAGVIPRLKVLVAPVQLLPYPPYEGFEGGDFKLQRQYAVRCYFQISVEHFTHLLDLSLEGGDLLVFGGGFGLEPVDVPGDVVGESVAAEKVVVSISLRAYGHGLVLPGVPLFREPGDLGAEGFAIG